MVSAWQVGGTRSLGIVSSAADVLWINVVRGMRGVGGVCEMCMRLARGLGFTNPMGTGGVLDVSLCFGCGGVCGVGWEWVGAFTRV